MNTSLLIKILSETNNVYNMELFLKALFTKKELREMENRLKIFQLLLQGKKQREISEILNVGIATVTRGASALENEDIFKVNSKVIQILKTNKIDLTNSTNPFNEKILPSPFIGSSLFHLKPSAFELILMPPPTIVCIKMIPKKQGIAKNAAPKIINLKPCQEL